MFHLHFYPGIYQQRHIPIHYLLLVGYDEHTAYVHDTGLQQVQAVPIDELEPAWNVNVPGLGKRNRLVVLNISERIAPTDLLIRRAIGDQCRTMLNPPVSMIGIPAMEKVGRELANWPDELGQEAAEMSLLQVREYLNSPPDRMGNHLTAGRDLYIKFLEQAGPMADLDFSPAIECFRSELAIFPSIADAIRKDELSYAAKAFSSVSKLEKAAFQLLLDLICKNTF
jgi:hypothetical protein